MPLIPNLLQIGLASLIALNSSQMAPVVIMSAASSVEDLIVTKAQTLGLDSQNAVKIAFCESGLQQFNQNGQVLRGERNPADVGVFQINERYHLEKSRTLGFDIYTTAGNLDYALWLLKNEGTRHWNSSRFCWALGR